MAWNRPHVDSQTKKPLRRERTVRPMRGVIAGAIVAVGAGIVAWLIWPSEDQQPNADSTKTVSHIREVKPATASKPEEQTRGLTADEKRLKEIADIEARWAGKEMPIGIKTHLYYLKNPPKKTITVKVPFDYLRHTCERDIAGVGLAKPGSFFVVQPEYGESFDNDFINALLDHIEISPEDSDEVRETKQAVEALKKDIARICREEGKKPSEIMNEHAKTLFELGRFQENIEQELIKVRQNPDISDDDVKDFFEAANTMLKNKGLEQMKIPDLTHRSLILQLKQKHALNKGKSE